MSEETGDESYIGIASHEKEGEKGGKREKGKSEKMAFYVC